MPSVPSDPSKPQDAAATVRLDSWKEIATYLGRGERTAKRWESERSLPVHRLPGGGRGSVYALAAELDEWLKSGRDQAPDITEGGDEAAEPSEAQPIAIAGNLQPSRRGFKPGWRPVIAGFVAVGVMAAVVFAFALHFAAGGILQRISSVTGMTKPAASHPALAVVSDAEEARAHELYLKGRYEWNQRTPDSLNRALDDFTQAVVHDPNSAEAYAGMADTYEMLRIYSTMPEAVFYPRAMAAASRAVELDDSLPEAHRALGFAAYFGTWNFAEGEKEFRRAIELNPRDPLAHKWFANELSAEGQMAESLEEISKAQELDPASFSILADKGMILFRSGKMEEGSALLKEVERSDPELSSPHGYQMDFDFELRDYTAYLAEGEKTAEARNDPVLKEIISSARAGYALGGEGGLLNSLYTEEEKYYAEGRFSGVRLAITCVRLGKKPEALHLLEEAYAHHYPEVLPGNLILRSRGVWAPLMNEPRFQALLKKDDGQAAPSRALASSAVPSNRAHLDATSEQ